MATPVRRGHNREPCFFGEEDFLSYLHRLGEALIEAECASRLPNLRLRTHDQPCASVAHPEEGGSSTEAHRLARPTLCAINQSHQQTYRPALG